MPTLSEIAAAKKAAAAAQAAAPPPPPRETIAEAAELKLAIDRIDPPGKQDRPQARGLVLRMTQMDKAEPRGQATPVAGPPDERALSQTSGEAIDTTPAAADPQTAAWHQAAVGLESELVVMSDPSDPTVCWLALRPASGRPLPLLLHRLPWTLWEHPQTPRPEDAPF